MFFAAQTAVRRGDERPKNFLDIKVSHADLYSSANVSFFPDSSGLGVVKAKLTFGTGFLQGLTASSGLNTILLNVS